MMDLFYGAEDKRQKCRRLFHNSTAAMELTHDVISIIFVIIIVLVRLLMEVETVKGLEDVKVETI